MVGAYKPINDYAKHGLFQKLFACDPSVCSLIADLGRDLAELSLGGLAASKAVENAMKT